MIITDARWANADMTSLGANIDGAPVCVPAIVGNQHFDAIVAQGITVLDYSPPPPSIDDVTAERSRRMALGFDYDFADARGIHHIGTTDADMKGWDEVTTAAQAAIALGQATMTLNIVTNTGPVVVTALEWQQALLAASAARQPLWAASFALEATIPIPSDFKDDRYWGAA
jgi:hypothetical protein